MAHIIYTEQQWRNSHLSIARHFGGVLINGEEYLIVNKYGITLMELSDPNSKYYVKNGQAILPGEPADLINKKYISKYKKLGRDAFIAEVKNGTIA